MTESEYTALQSEREIITAVDLSNKEDRTLLFGVVYSPNEYVYHAYIKSGVIYSVTYPAVSPNTVEHRSINCDSDWMLAPVYAKHSDFEFVKLVLDCMRDMDVKKPYIKHPSFTYPKHNKQSVYHGAVLPGHYIQLHEQGSKP